MQNLELKWSDCLYPEVSDGQPKHNRMDSDIFSTRSAATRTLPKPQTLKEINMFEPSSVDCSSDEGIKYLFIQSLNGNFNKIPDDRKTQLKCKLLKILYNAKFEPKNCVLDDF